MREETRYHPDAVIGEFGRVASAVARGEPRDAILEVIASSVRRLVDADLTTVALRLRNGRVRTVAADGVDADRYRGQEYDPESSYAVHVLRSGVPVVVDDLSSVPLAKFRAAGQPLGPTVFAPIRVEGPYGSLSACRVRGREPFSTTDLDVISAFAAQSGTVIENDGRRRKTIGEELERERSRIAAELQGSAINEIFAASLTLARVVNECRGQERELVVHAVGSLDHSIKLIRQAVYGLRDRAESGRPDE
jgi:two-component system, NarL family, sensor histidine kinase DevS